MKFMFSNMIYNKAISNKPAFNKAISHKSMMGKPFNRYTCFLDRFACIIFLLSFSFLSACSGSNNETKDALALEVFKSPTCGCCTEWVSHLEKNGFSSTVQNQTDLSQIKHALNIPVQLQSCHTGISKDGYFFEGHIPAKYIRQFLTNPPKNAKGLAVPGMPAGSPGMEMGDKFDPYAILLVMADGSTPVYANVSTLEEQHQ